MARKFVSDGCRLEGEASVSLNSLASVDVKDYRVIYESRETRLLQDCDQLVRDAETLGEALKRNDPETLTDESGFVTKIRTNCSLERRENS